MCGKQTKKSTIAIVLFLMLVVVGTVVFLNSVNADRYIKTQLATTIIKNNAKTIEVSAANVNSNNSATDNIQESIITRVVEGEEKKVAENINMTWKQLNVVAKKVKFDFTTATESKFEKLEKTIESDATNNDFVVPGEEFTYKIVIIAKENMNNVEVRDVLPIEVTPVEGDSIKIGKITVDKVERDVVKTAVNLKAGEELIVSFKVKVKDDVEPNTKIENTAIVNGEKTTTSEIEVKELVGTVNYFDSENNEKIKTSTLLKELTLNETISAEDYIEEIDGYVYKNANPESIEIRADAEKNVLNLYYTKRNDLTGIVNYIDKDGNNEVIETLPLTDLVFKSTVLAETYKKEINGYSFDSAEPESIIVSTTESENVLNIYYTRNSYNYTIKYVEKDVNPENVLATETGTALYKATVAIPEKEFDGFEYDSQDKDEIVIDIENNTAIVYYTRNSYNYTIKYVEKDANPENVLATETGTALYKATVAIPEKEFDGFEYDSQDKDEIVIDIENNTATVYYKKAGSLIINFESDYPRGETQAEPGDTVTINLTIDEENGVVNYPKTISVKLNVLTRGGESVEKPITVDTSNLPEGATYDPETDTLTWIVNSINDSIDLKVTINDNVPAGSNIIFENVDGARPVGDDPIAIEQTVKIEKPLNKNIVMVLDVSGSMNFCTKHGESYTIDSNGRTPWSASNVVGCGECGKEHLYTEYVSGAWYSTGSYDYKCSVHNKTVGNSKNPTDSSIFCLDCAKEYTSRLASLKIASKAFAESVISNKKDNENISITLVTFATDVKVTNTIKNPTISSINNAIDAMTASGGTNMRKAISSATDVFNGNNVYQGDNVKNVLVFLSDGEPDQNNYKLTNSSETINALNNVKNLEKFVVGLGDSFDRTELECIVGEGNIDRIYEATDTDTLVSEFNKIADKINSMQTTNGYFGDILSDTVNIYPVILSYTNASNELVEITANNEATLNQNYVEINENGKITWDVSQYPGSKNFVIKLGTGAALRSLKMSISKLMIASSASVNSSISESEFVWTVVYRGDPNESDIVKYVEEIGEDEISDVVDMNDNNQFIEDVEIENDNIEDNYETETEIDVNTVIIENNEIIDTVEVEDKDIVENVDEKVVSEVEDIDMDNTEEIISDQEVTDIDAQVQEETILEDTVMLLDSAIDESNNLEEISIVDNVQ